MATYKFVKNFDPEPDPNDTITLFFQIATFPRPEDKKFHVRRFMVNSKDEFNSVKDYFLTNKQYQKFMQKRKPNEYKTFAVYNLKMVKYPTLGDILAAKSNMISIDPGYYGSAPF